MNLFSILLSCEMVEITIFISNSFDKTNTASTRDKKQQNKKFLSQLGEFLNNFVFGIKSQSVEAANAM